MSYRCVFQKCYAFCSNVRVRKVVSDPLVGPKEKSYPSRTHNQSEMINSEVL